MCEFEFLKVLKKFNFLIIFKIKINKWKIAGLNLLAKQKLNIIKKDENEQLKKISRKWKGAISFFKLILDDE